MRQDSATLNATPFRGFEQRKESVTSPSGHSPFRRPFTRPKNATRTRPCVCRRTEIFCVQCLRAYATSLDVGVRAVELAHCRLPILPILYYKSEANFLFCYFNERACYVRIDGICLAPDVVLQLKDQKAAAIGERTARADTKIICSWECLPNNKMLS